MGKCQTILLSRVAKWTFVDGLGDIAGALFPYSDPRVGNSVGSQLAHFTMRCIVIDVRWVRRQASHSLAERWERKGDGPWTWRGDLDRLFSSGHLQKIHGEILESDTALTRVLLTFHSNWDYFQELLPNCIIASY